MFEKLCIGSSSAVGGIIATVRGSSGALLRLWQDKVLPLKLVCALGLRRRPATHIHLARHCLLAYTRPRRARKHSTRHCSHTLVPDELGICSCPSPGTAPISCQPFPRIASDKNVPRLRLAPGIFPDLLDPRRGTRPSPEFTFYSYQPCRTNDEGKVLRSSTTRCFTFQ
jgi:hypothetical protein